jgi:hypothetical protein
MSDIDITALLERITGCINNAEYDDEADTLSDAFTVIEALEAQLKTVLDREADTHCRHDAKVEALGAENERLRGHLDVWIFHNQRAMGQKPDDARAYAKAWLFRNADGEEPE